MENVHAPTPSGTTSVGVNEVETHVDGVISVPM